jgi:nucleotide-binding universal stress UspA family protein
MSGIIVGIDGSSHSQHALEWAIREAALRKVPLRVLTVYRTTVGYWGGPVTYPQDAALAGQAREAAREATEKALAQAGGVRPESVVVDVICGIPSEELVSASKGADLIVVGARGSGGFARLLLGSVSSQVAHHAHCPAVVIPAEDRQ